MVPSFPSTVRLLLLGLLLLSGCADVFPPSYEYGRLEVQAVRRNGDPVAEVQLVLYSGERHLDYGTTGADGRFVFRFVPQGYFGVGAVAPQGYEFPPLSRPFVEEVRLTRGGADSVSFTLLKHGPGTIQVQTVALSGEPVGGVPVTLYTHRGPVMRGVSDDRGSYTFGTVAFGNYGVSIGSLIGYRVVTPFRDGILVEEGSEERVQLQLERCVGTVRVRVLDPEGRPLRGIPLVLYTFRGTVAEASTDERGGHEFREVGCGIEYGVRVELPRGFGMAGGTRPYVDGIDPAREKERSITFRVEPCRGRVTAVVVDRSGAPVPNALVTLYTFRESLAEERTDALGRATFAQVVCDEVGVRVTPPAGYTAQPGRGTTYMDGIRVENGSEETARLVVDRQ